MPYSPSTRVKRIIVIIVLVMVGGSLVIPATSQGRDAVIDAAAAAELVPL